MKGTIIYSLGLIQKIKSYRRRYVIETTGIQGTLFEYFQDMDSFTLEEARECVINARIQAKEPSIRARIYEGIDKGIFTRLARGVYTVTRTDQENHEITCMLINGDGRDLSFIQDNSIDAIITDSPYDMPKSHKGGNRNFTSSYACFNYSQRDLDEKYRVLKPGCFLVEFLPEENGENFRYLFKVKDMAERAGLTYYASVPWKKGNFVSNTGRKAHNTEQVVMFTKGKARSLRPDAKKDKAEPEIAHYMSGAAGMLPTVFDVPPPNKAERRHQAEKPVELLKQILDFVTQENELILDQYCGSGSMGEAALKSNRDSILIEIDETIYKEACERVQKVR